MVRVVLSDWLIGMASRVRLTPNLLDCNRGKCRKMRSGKNRNGCWLKHWTRHRCGVWCQSACPVSEWTARCWRALAGADRRRQVPRPAALQWAKLRAKQNPDFGRNSPRPDPSKHVTGGRADATPPQHQLQVIRAIHNFVLTSAVRLSIPPAMRTEYIAPVLSGIANLQNLAQQWYLDKGVTWPPQPPVNKIDIHHHFVPDFYAQGMQPCF